MDRALVHDSTFGGNALAMVAGLATLSVIDDEGLVGNADADRRPPCATVCRAMVEHVRDARRRARPGPDDRHRVRRPEVVAACGAGGRCCTRTRNGLFSQAVVGALYHRHGILTQVAADHAEVVKLLPPLMIGPTEVRYFLDSFAEVMDDAHRTRGLAWDLGRTMMSNALRR